jgi:hypothetical protein
MEKLCSNVEKNRKRPDLPRISPRHRLLPAMSPTSQFHFYIKSHDLFGYSTLEHNLYYLKHLHLDM